MKKLFSAENSSPFCRDKEKRKNCKKKKGNPLNLDCSVAVLTLDVSLDVGANNNCLLQLNALAEIELCVQRRPAHRADKEAASQMELTGLHRDEIFKVWLVDKLTRPSSSALSCPSSLPCQWPISKSRFHNLLLQTYCLIYFWSCQRAEEGRICFDSIAASFMSLLLSLVARPLSQLRLAWDVR